METGKENIVPGTRTPASRTFRTLMFVGRILVAAGVLYMVLQMVSVEKVVVALRTASLPYIVAGASLLVANIGTRVMKWRSMLRIVRDESTWWESFTSVLLGITLGSFTPGQLGELGGRSMRVNHSKSSHVVGLTLVDRTQVFLVLAMTGALSYPFFLTNNVPLALFAGTGCAALCVYLYFRIDLIKRFADKINLKILRHEWIDGIIESFTFIGRDHFLSTLLYSLGFYVVILLQMYFLLNAFVAVSLWRVFLGFSAMMFFKSLVNISISDIGIREASTVYFFSLLGVPDAAALSASVLMFAINIIIPSLFGILFLPKLRRWAGLSKNLT
ncbi:MAG TPA: lysylphosphatidylglycerol synthase transmembrane domain-containing protein [Bacteroidota bacterium]